MINGRSMGEKYQLVIGGARKPIMDSTTRPFDGMFDLFKRHKKSLLILVCSFYTTRSFIASNNTLPSTDPVG
jgi:hypothetical protein